MTDAELRSDLSELTALVNSLSYDNSRVIGGTKSAHTQMRNKLQAVKKLSDKLRREVLQHQKSLPTKSRVKKVAAEPVVVKSLDPDEIEPVKDNPTPPPSPKTKKATRRKRR